MFRPIIDRIQEITSVKYGEKKTSDVSIRVIADHARSIAFMISDGILPSNEGRGYVLRRVLRRAIRHGSLLGYTRPFLYRIIETVTVNMGKIYPELVERLSFTQEMTLKEEERFLSTLENGERRLRTMLLNKKELTGDELFSLHDTYGFPLELVEEIVGESDIKLDREGFKEAMNKQRERAREALGEREYLENIDAYSRLFASTGNSKFTGYSKMIDNSTIQAILINGLEVPSLKEGETGEIVVANTPFYAQKGGQITDTGYVETKDGSARVEYVFSPYQEMIVHRVTVVKGVIVIGSEVELAVDRDRRLSTMRNHTATHLLHSALRKILGDHVHQSGSLVLPDRLRFDFSHFQSLTSEQLKEIENLVNFEIMKAVPVEVEEVDFSEIKGSDVTALFEEKYGDKVRVISIEDFSKELCGGTHVRNTGEIGLFKILSETSVAAGTRRVEAITGMASLEVLQRLSERERFLRELLEVPEDKMIERLDGLLRELKDRERFIMQLKERLLSGDSISDDRRIQIDGTNVLVRKVEGAPSNALRNASDVLLGKEGGGIVIIFNEMEDSISFVVKVQKDLTKRFNAGEIARKIAKEIGGGGGGRPDFAQAGGKEIDKLRGVIQNIDEYLR